MFKKILLLNSGGFDSVCLAYHIRELYPNIEVLNLFFNYGQQTLEAEKNCSKKCCEKLNFEFMEVTLPKFNWSNSDFYNQGFISAEKQEVEFRNLVFLSYSASISVAKNCDAIFMAVLESLGYVDTSKDFLNGVNNILKLKDIELVTPFANLNKNNLLPTVFRNNLTKNDFNTCDTPINGEPCGECGDCKITNHLLNLCSKSNPLSSWLHSGYDPNNKDFTQSLINAPLKEARLLINNKCQLNCKHCFYGFKDMASSPLTVDEYKKVIDDCYNLGIRNFHFSGKEPLIDDLIFIYAQYIKDHYIDATYEVVTNGLTLPMKAEKIKDLGFSKVYLSVDDVLGLQELRTSDTTKALETIRDYKLPCQVFIDLHINNYNHIDEIIEVLHKEYGIEEFFVRTIHNIGNGASISRLSEKCVETAFKKLKESSIVNLPIVITFSITAPYTYNFLFSDKYDFMRDSILQYIKYLGMSYDNILLSPELFCERYASQITVTPDGYILGCGTEMSIKDYPKYSAGNVKDDELFNIVTRGKKSCVKCNQLQVDTKGNLKFFNCIRKPIDDLL